MGSLEKLEVLAAAAHYDVCGYNGIQSFNASPSQFIHRVAVPGKGMICLFKVLLTNVCMNDCAYCVNQIGRDSMPRRTFLPEELAGTFMELNRRKMAHGLFLSSGIAGNATRTMEAMIDTVIILRKRFEFKGYIHLKILPGASFDCVEQACKLANRVSINMEAPTAEHLSKLSAKKNLLDDIVERMRWIQQISTADERIIPAGQTTQFVVGAAGETDRELLSTTSALYQEIGLRRAYFSPFVPVRDSRSEGLHAAPPIRAHRLYQSDWLLRIYRFPFKELELALDDQNDLSLTKDPKMTIALKQPWIFPVDVNQASYDELLRVPGIGPVSATRILETRKDHSIDSSQQLKKMGIILKRASPFIWFRGTPVIGRQTSFLSQFDDALSQEAPSLATAVR